MTDPDAAGEVLFADVLLLPNGMSKVGAETTLNVLGSLWLLLGFHLDGICWIDGSGTGCHGTM